MITQHNENNSAGAIAFEQNNDLGVETRKVRGPTLLKDIWNMPIGKTIIVRFNGRNQAIGKVAKKLASFLGIVARTPELVPLNIDDWRSFDKDEKTKLVEFVRKKFSIPTCGEEFVKKSIGKKWKDYKCDLRSTYMMKYKTKDVLLKNRPNRIPRDQWAGLVSYWLSDKGKKRCYANRSNRKKLKMHHTGGSKSIGTLMDEMAKDGIEPTRAEVFILTHTKRKDGRPLDEESAKVVDMIIEKLNDDDTSNEQVVGSVAWEGDVLSQVFGPDKSGHVRGLGLGPTPLILWGTKSSLKNIAAESIPNEMLKKLEQEVKELKEKHSEEMISMKQNQNKILSELSSLKRFLSNRFTAKQFITREFMTRNINGSSSRQILDANTGQERPPHATKVLFQSHGRIFTASHGIPLELKHVYSMLISYFLDLWTILS